jgi:hypothetical protein
MGDTLLFSNEQGAYTLTDRGTYLSMVDKLPNLEILVGGQNLAENKDKVLLNPYGVLVVNPEKWPAVNYDLARKFATWLLSVDTQKAIGGYGADKFGQPLFYPSSEAYKATVAPAPEPAPAAGVTGDLVISGAVEKPSGLTEADLRGIEVIKITAEHPKKGKEDYEGVRRLPGGLHEHARQAQDGHAGAAQQALGQGRDHDRAEVIAKIRALRRATEVMVAKD